MTGVWRIVACVAVLLYASEALCGIGSLRKRWPQGRAISVCFLGGDSEIRSLVAATAREWIDQVSVSFDFGQAPAFNECDGKRAYDIRVGFEVSGNWSYVGTDALKVSTTAATVNLQSLRAAGSHSRATILEEFGHVLGILHMEQDPETNCRAELNLDYFRDVLGIPENEIDRRFFPPTVGGGVAANNGEYLSTGLDKESVTRLFTRPEHFKGGASNRCYGPPTDRLSARDRKLVQLLYPPKPPDVSAADPKQLTVRFEGALASEHFGYILSALYGSGKIALRQHVSRKPETMEDVVAEERLAPRGVTAASLEGFLCQINRHVCTDVKGTRVWSNTEAIKNYVDAGIGCADKSLPKYVLCIPNIRLESYNSVITILYDGRRGKPVKDIVEKLGGCQSWDDRCRDLIKRLNAVHEGKFLSTPDLLPNSFLGELRLPARNYRLVLEYADRDEKRTLEGVVAEAIGARAAQLNVGRDKLAIDVTEPIGNPKLQQSAALCVAPPGAAREPMATLGNPYLPPEGRTALAQLGPVDIGVWDTHIDKDHCALGGDRVIFPTYVESSPNQPPPTPPDRTASCGAPVTSRTSGHDFRERYDHATAVAGLLVGRGHGVSGVYSKTRLWAYELLNGDQINKGDPILTMFATHALDPKVINISQTFEVNTDASKTSLESLLFGSPNRDGWHGAMLFVAAAGKGDTFGRHIDDTGCNFFPACWGNTGKGPRGLISVVALNNSGNDLVRNGSGEPLTNYGLAFDVSAVGQTTSAYYGNYVGPVCGSSFAAPYVAGLAALIYAKAKARALVPSAAEVKDRILFTADRLPNLNESRFGRVNYARALDFQNDWMEYKPTAICPSGACLRASVSVDRFKPEEIRAQTGTLDGSVQILDMKIPFKRVRSLFAEADGLFTVRFVDETGKLRILERAVISTTGLKIVKSGDSYFPLDLTAIQQFISCSFAPGCRFQ